MKNYRQAYPVHCCLYAEKQKKNANAVKAANELNANDDLVAVSRRAEYS